MNAPGTTLAPWRAGDFQVHFIHTGVAESIFLVFPDATTMLLDCGDHAAITRGVHAVPALPGPHRLAGEWVGRYVRRVNPNGDDVDWLVISHFHADHVGSPRWQKFPWIPAPFPGAPEEPGPIGNCPRSGIGLVAEYLRFRRATERGYPGYDDPLPLRTDFGDVPESCALVRSVWDILRRRDGLVVEPFRLGATDQFVPERGAAPGFSVRNVCANGRISLPDGTVRDLLAERIARERPVSLNENALSLGMVFSYGAFRLFTGGDFSDSFPGPDGGPVFIEDALGDAVGPVHVAKIDHHGHHSTGRVLAAALRPRVWVACVWDNLHCTDDTVESLLVPDAPDAVQPLLLPTVLPVRPDGERPWWRFVPMACRTGCHVVLTVPPGGETFSLTLVDARDEEMRVAAEYGFRTRAGDAD